MPGLGTVKILVDADTLAAMVTDHLSAMYRKDIQELRQKIDDVLPVDAILLEVRAVEREPGKLMMVWSHPSFPTDEIPYSSPEPHIPANWDYIK